jgi:hypothetical protein
VASATTATDARAEPGTATGRALGILLALASLVRSHMVGRGEELHVAV